MSRPPLPPAPGGNALARRQDPEVAAALATLAALRRQQGISQPALDDRIGVTEGQVAKWETGLRTPTLRSLLWWGEALGYALHLVPRQGEGPAVPLNGPPPPPPAG